MLTLLLQRIHRYLERAWSPASSVATMDRLKGDIHIVCFGSYDTVYTVEHSPSPPPVSPPLESRIVEITLMKVPGKGEIEKHKIQNEQ